MSKLTLSSILRRHRSQEGFTIVELMVATLVFSVILVVVTAGVISFTRGYYKSINSSATQTTARNVMVDIAQGIQYAGNATVSQSQNGQSGCIAVGAVHYNYYIGRELDGTPGNYGVYETTNPLDNCDATDTTNYAPLSDTGGRELLGLHMRVTNITVTPPADDPSGAGLGSVEIGVAYGDDDLLCSTNINATDPGGCDSSAATFTPDMYVNINDQTNGETAVCKAATGSQFCAATHLSTAVQPRLGN